jgi:large subunit ribosomal protein L25
LEIIKLTSRPRTGTGKSYTRKTRVDGWIPAVYYGHSVETQPLEINARDFGAIVRARQTTHLFDLGIGGDGKAVAIIKEIQRDVVIRDHFLHIDFQHVDMNEKITVRVPLEIAGVPVGVKEEDGILGHPVQQLTVECLPRDIPESIKIDVSELHIGDAIHVSDISIENVTMKDPPEEVLANVTHAAKIELETPAEEEAEGEEGAAGEAQAAESES